MSIVRLEIFRNRFGAISVITGLSKQAFQHKMIHAIVIEIFCIIAYAHDLLTFRMTMISFLCQEISIGKTLAISITSSQTVIKLAYFQHMPCLHSNGGFVWWLSHCYKFDHSQARWHMNEIRCCIVLSSADQTPLFCILALLLLVRIRAIQLACNYIKRSMINLSIMDWECHYQGAFHIKCFDSWLLNLAQTCRTLLLKCNTRQNRMESKQMKQGWLGSNYWCLYTYFGPQWPEEEVAFHTCKQQHFWFGQWIHISHRK